MIGPILGGASIFRNWPDANVLCDGNSLVAGQGALYNESKMPAQLSVKAPLSSVYTRVGNIGQNGQTINQMRGRVAANVTPRFVAGKRNILIAWEATNAICNIGGTADSAIANFTGYCADVRAGNPGWYIILLTTLPRGNIPSSAYTVAQANAQLDSFNAQLLANFRAIGADAVVDVRAPGSPFALPGYTTEDFASSPFTNFMGPDKVHLLDAGYALVADMIIAQAFRRLRAR